MFQTAEEKDKTQANNWMKWRYTIYQKKKKKERKKEIQNYDSEDNLDSQTKEGGQWRKDWIDVRKN